MNLTMLIIDSLLLLGTVCVSLYGASALPPGAKVPIHFGPASYNNWVPKNVGLILWPTGAAVLYVVLVVTARNKQATGGGGGAAIGLTVALVVVLITQMGALRVALNRSSGKLALYAPRGQQLTPCHAATLVYRTKRARGIYAG